MGFLPKDYSAPVTKNYMDLEEGENRIRILGPSPVFVGNEYWIDTDEGRRPVRVPMNTPIDESELAIDPRTGEKTKIKHFWALKVWNYAAKKVQMLLVHQKTIREGIRGLTEDQEWGEPDGKGLFAYDISIKQSKANDRVSYSVSPKPKTQLAEEIVKANESVKINFNALFDGTDAFKAHV